MQRLQLKNFVLVTVSTGYNAAATSIILQTGHGALLPSATPYFLLWWNVTDYADPSSDPNREWVLVTDLSGDTLTISRGQDGSIGSTKNTAGKVYKMQLCDNAGLFNDLYDRHRFPTCGRFNYVGTTECKFVPFKGNMVMIDGKLEEIPSAGVSFSNSGLTANIEYYAYLKVVSGVVTGEWQQKSSAPHSADTTTGQEIKTGDPTRTLVGMCMTDGTGLFDTRWVVSWFNPRLKVASAVLAADRQTLSTNYTEIPQASERVGFLTWADWGIEVRIVGAVKNSNAGQLVYTSLAFDGGSAEDVCCLMHAPTANYYGNLGLSFTKVLAEGYHYAAIMGKVDANTGTWRGSVTTADRTRIEVLYWG